MLLSKYGLEVTRLELGFDGLPAGFDGCVAVQKIDHLLQGTGGYRFQSFGHGCFGGVLPW